MSIECLSRLITLNLENCSRLECLSSSFCKLKSLQHLNLSGCTKVERLPDEFGNLEALREMKAERSSIREVPSSIVQLNNLYRLSFEGYQSKSHMGLRLPTMSGLRILTNLDRSYFLLVSYIYIHFNSYNMKIFFSFFFYPDSFFFLWRLQSYPLKSYSLATETC